MFGANWKTTVSGIASALFGFIAFNQTSIEDHYKPISSGEPEWLWWLVLFSKYAAVGGLVSLGIAAKDKNVTGGTTPNDPPAPTK